MPEASGKHLDYDDRCIIEERVGAGFSASAIAREIGVSLSTITREVKTNRVCRVPKRKDVKPAKRCNCYFECKKAAEACKDCMRDIGHSYRRPACRLCKEVVCCDFCKDFAPRECEKVACWPYVCSCPAEERNRCYLPKWSYRAVTAGESSKARLSESRCGISVPEEKLEEMFSTVFPLIKNGLSIEAIWMSKPEGTFPVTARTFRSWMESGIIEIPALYLPRKVRIRPRKKAKGIPPKDKAIYKGRLYTDFLALPDEIRTRVVEGDTVWGYDWNSARILSLHFKRMEFQLYLSVPDGTASSTVEWFDTLERILGSPEAFENVMGIILLDRGEEFTDVVGLERSCLVEGAKRCQIYFCDAVNPGQKGSCERNHSELRRILPKGRSDFDRLTLADTVLLTSHVSSYHRKSLNGACPIDLAKILLPEGFLEQLGIVKIPTEEVLLRPSLMSHVVTD